MNLGLLSFPLLILGSCLTQAAKSSLPEGMHRDMYCIGCEMMMKVVDRALRDVAADQVEGAVPETLSKVCQPDLLEISEYSKDVLNDACKHLISNYGLQLKTHLISEYKRGKQVSYLDLVKRVCLTMTDACRGVLHDSHNHDPLKDDAHVNLDPETNEFVVLPGKNLKVASPIRGSHGQEEL